MNPDAPPPVIVYPALNGHRRVAVRGERVGTARGVADLVEFLRRAGLEADDSTLTDPELIEWRGGGPDAW
ncbi:hypothetical protein [Actinacidiphila soli]|jgi:hypothetical protein|uniref:hypothetical protein n=1 Tax=Actinacidiphila soli TaxID=2487275 RepID=UPI000FC995DB|nr:hypothetical protein [Actinacidiphila soli]